MKFSSRLLLALLVVGVDLLTIAVPLTAFAAAYVLLARPAGFLHWVIRIYDEDASRAGG